MTPGSGREPSVTKNDGTEEAGKRALACVPGHVVQELREFEKIGLARRGLAPSKPNLALGFGRTEMQ